MRALVVYESMFGNTHEVAVRIGMGLDTAYDVTVVPVAEATHYHVAGADLVVVGGPTHVHGMSSERTRSTAADQAAQHDDLELDVAADGPGVREWLNLVSLADGVPAAAFDTRVDGPVMFTGRASKAIARQLERHGFRLIVEPESFLVDRHNHLVPGEPERATEWGTQVASLVSH